MLYLSLEDLFKTEKPDTFYFGQGDMAYKEWFGNASKVEMSVVLFKKTMAHRIWRGTHATYNWTIRHVRDGTRRLLGRK